MTRTKQPAPDMYSDILGPEPEGSLLRAVELLDQTLASVSMTEAPPQVMAAIERLAQSPPPRNRPRFSGPRRLTVGSWLPRRFRPVFAVVLVVLLAAATYRVVPVLDRAFYVDAGTQQIVSQDLGTPLNLSQTEAGYTVTLQRAYADANRVVVGYTIQGPDHQPFEALDRLAYLQSTLADASGTILQPLGGDVAQGGSVLDSFDASSIAGKPRDVRLQLTIPLFQALGRAGQTVPVASAPFIFSFAVPLLPARVATPAESVTAGGETITLERVVVSPTETRLYLRGLGGTGILPHLSVDAWDSGKVPLVGWAPGQATEISGGVWQTKGGLVVCDFLSPLSDKQGEWTFVVRAGPATLDGRQVLGGPWLFHFTVPTANS